jgi:hypothetical protein
MNGTEARKLTHPLIVAIALSRFSSLVSGEYDSSIVFRNLETSSIDEMKSV